MTDRDEHDPVEDTRMTLGEHLDELRKRLIRAGIVFAVAFIALYSLRDRVIYFVASPYDAAVTKLNADLVDIRRKQVEEDPELRWEDYFRSEEMAELLQVEEIPPFPTAIKSSGPFIPKIRACFCLALVIAGPVFLWEMWMFIAAGLYRAERKVVYTYFPTSLLLFVGGVVFGFLVLLPAAIYFLQGDGLGVDPIPRMMELDAYMQFLRTLTLALGVVFQLPVFQIGLSKMGVVRPSYYAKYRGHMAIIALLVAAIITPPDPVTQIILAGPAIVLWEVGYWISRWVWKEPEEAVEDVGVGQGAGA